MEAKINIATILKDKPEGTKLWTDMFGSVTLYVVTDACDSFQVKHHNKEPWFDKEGKLCKEGVLCIYPSKSMRDWSKFAWKKGDVLVSNDGNKKVFFGGFTDDTYALFKAKHGLEVLSNGDTLYLGDEDGIATSDYTLEDNDVAQTYINTIEERLGGKLNRETLEVEKTQPEFKDGDIVAVDLDRKNIRIFKEKKNENNICFGKYYIGFSFNNEGKLIQTFKNYTADCSSDRLATEEEKQQLFDALAKEGKAWDAENKEVADLKPKVKPFDRVLVRDSKSDNWRANLFGYIGKDGYYHCVYANWAYCIPYIGNESLLGTTKDVEG